MTRVLANATVDLIRQADVGLNRYRVEVYGKEPHDFVRIYDISSKTDNAAAREGLDRFVAEMEAKDAQP